MKMISLNRFDRSASFWASLCCLLLQLTTLSVADVAPPLTRAYDIPPPPPPPKTMEEGVWNSLNLQSGSMMPLGVSARSFPSAPAKRSMNETFLPPPPPPRPSNGANSRVYLTLNEEKIKNEWVQAPFPRSHDASPLPNPPPPPPPRLRSSTTLDSWTPEKEEVPALPNKIPQVRQFKSDSSIPFDSIHVEVGSETPSLPLVGSDTAKGETDHSPIALEKALLQSIVASNRPWIPPWYESATRISSNAIEQVVQEIGRLTNNIQEEDVSTIIQRLCHQRRRRHIQLPGTQSKIPTSTLVWLEACIVLSLERNEAISQLEQVVRQQQHELQRQQQRLEMEREMFASKLRSTLTDFVDMNDADMQRWLEEDSDGGFEELLEKLTRGPRDRDEDVTVDKDVDMQTFDQDSIICVPLQRNLWWKNPQNVNKALKVTYVSLGTQLLSSIPLHVQAHVPQRASPPEWTILVEDLDAELLDDSDLYILARSSDGRAGYELLADDNTATSSKSPNDFDVEFDDDSLDEEDVLLLLESNCFERLDDLELSNAPSGSAQELEQSQPAHSLTPPPPPPPRPKVLMEAKRNESLPRGSPSADAQLPGSCDDLLNGPSLPPPSDDGRSARITIGKTEPHADFPTSDLIREEGNDPKPNPLSSYLSLFRWMPKWSGRQRTTGLVASVKTTKHHQAGDTPDSPSMEEDLFLGESAEHTLTDLAYYAPPPPPPPPPVDKTYFSRFGTTV